MARTITNLHVDSTDAFTSRVFYRERAATLNLGGDAKTPGVMVFAHRAELVRMRDMLNATLELLNR